MTVELVYDTDCPNAAAARAQLLRAFREAKLPPRWVEWDRDDRSTPERARAYGSPTILVDGKDVGGAAPGPGAASCRLYRGWEGGFSGVPAVEDIAAALTGRARGVRRTGWRDVAGRVSLVVPGSVVALLPVGTCPACWPAYAAALSAFGLGFLFDTVYRFPLTVLFVAIALLGLGYRAKRRRGYGPLWLGVTASSGLLAGHLPVGGIGSSGVTYAGAGLLIAASLWNAWPLGRTAATACSACSGEPRTRGKEETKGDR